MASIKMFYMSKSGKFSMLHNGKKWYLMAYIASEIKGGNYAPHWINRHFDDDDDWGRGHQTQEPPAKALATLLCVECYDCLQMWEGHASSLPGHIHIKLCKPEVYEFNVPYSCVFVSNSNFIKRADDRQDSRVIFNDSCYRSDNWGQAKQCMPSNIKQ